MIPAYLIYDNKGNYYGAYRSFEKAKEIKTKIENEMRENNELKDIELEIIYSR